MKARFIGKDGSMDLKHGNVYMIKVTADDNAIYVTWKEEYPKDLGFYIYPYVTCPYSDFKKLAENWEIVS